MFAAATDNGLTIQGDISTTSWGAMALDFSPKSQGEITALIKLADENSPLLPRNFPAWSEWMGHDYFKMEVQAWKATYPLLATAVIATTNVRAAAANVEMEAKADDVEVPPAPVVKLPQITCKCGSTKHKRTNHSDCPLNKKNKKKADAPAAAAAAPAAQPAKDKKEKKEKKDKKDKKERHPSGRKNKRLQKLWEGEKGLRWIGETDKLKRHRTYNPRIGVAASGAEPHGLKWVELGYENEHGKTGEWHVYYARPTCPKKNPEKESRIIWDEYDGQWIKPGCYCNGDETCCKMVEKGNPPCACYL